MTMDYDPQKRFLDDWFDNIQEFLDNFNKKCQKVRFPNLPSRSYWVCKGYEPFSWTQEDIDKAKLDGWTNIKYHNYDEYPYLCGVWSGTDPENLGNWYLPKR